MPLINLVIVLIVVGVLLWLVNTYTYGSKDQEHPEYRRRHCCRRHHYRCHYRRYHHHRLRLYFHSLHLYLVFDHLNRRNRLFSPSVTSLTFAC